jgi:pimeloyl-ACP methyl ester carboxylesterase
VNTYHFLDYSGTRELAEDMERFRRLIGADRLSLYGISYGTHVMATYATMFPNNVELFVLDGSVSPGSDIFHLATIIGQGQQQRLDYLIYSCDNRDDCPVDDLESCITATNNLLREQVTYNHTERDEMALFLYVLFTEPEEKAEELCSAAASGNIDKITTILTAAKDEQDSAANGQQGNTTDDSTDEEVLLMSDSQPTLWNEDNITYMMLMEAPPSGFGIAQGQVSSTSRDPNYC